MVAVKRIGVAVDGSKPAEKALDLAGTLAASLGATLTLISVAPLHVMPPMAATSVPVIHDAEVAVHRQVLDDLQKRASAGGAKSIETVLLDGFVAEEILRYLEDHPVDLLVMGARGLSAGQRFFLGSVSDAVVHHAKCPVLIVRD